jgi:hypothetical protein
MAAGGQRRLRLPIFHARFPFGCGAAPSSGTILESETGDLYPQYRVNLANLLTSIRNHGFTEVEVGFFPLFCNSFSSRGGVWNEDLYQENWNLIVNLHGILVGSGLTYRIDLYNEAVPQSVDILGRQYTQRLWSDYNTVYSPADTVGFSLNGGADSADRVSQMRYIYSGIYPPVFDVHIYGVDGFSEYDAFKRIHDALAVWGVSRPLIIGETTYNDNTSGDLLRKAIDDTQHSVSWLAQWPVSRNGGCDVTVVPSQFEAYQNHNFGIGTPSLFSTSFEYPTETPSGWAIWHNCATDANWSASQFWTYNGGPAPDGGSYDLRLTSTRFVSGCSYPGLYALSPSIPASPGVRYYVDNMSRVASQFGSTSLIFYYASGYAITQYDQVWPSDSWVFKWDPVLSAIAPPGTMSMRVRYALQEQMGVVDLDLLNVRKDP